MNRPLKILSLLLPIALLFPGPVQAQSKVDSTKIVRVLSFNILHGRTTKGDFNLDVLANLIKKYDPDLVAMQEVDFKANRSKRYDLATELGWRTHMVPLFGKAMDFDGGEYGEAVLSRYSILQSRVVALPNLPKQEPRAALEVLTIIPAGDTIAFVGTHLAHEGEAGRILQVEKINEAFSQNGYPTILVGDLNAKPESEPIRILQKHWTTSYGDEDPAPTYPSDNPRIKIDYVMFSPANRWKVLERTVIKDTVASDHCAYLVSLQLLPQQ
ncbi:MAG: endonuclease/exonuclease/phosphatase family protein [Saprospiraceae bacterium]|nr:endonuclease/exonuclease/phosphatase family protein [Saprospiraceae bacterium]